MEKTKSNKKRIYSLRQEKTLKVRSAAVSGHAGLIHGPLSLAAGMETLACVTTKRGSAHTGRLHSLMAILMPPPHVREQVPKGLQTPHAPSTGVASFSLVMHRPCLQC